MRAFQLHNIGDAPRLTSCEVPTPKSGEIRLKIEACGLNFGDLLMINGSYQIGRASCRERVLSLV